MFRKLILLLMTCVFSMLMQAGGAICIDDILASYNNTVLLRNYLDNGGDVNSATETGFTLLMYGACKGYIEFTQILLAHRDIDVNQADDKGYTALRYAAGNPKKELVQILLDHPNIKADQADPFGVTPFMISKYIMYRDDIADLITQRIEDSRWYGLRSEWCTAVNSH